MTLRQLDPLVLESGLADWVEAAAAKAGLSTTEYLAGLVAADRRSSGLDRAHRLAAAAHREWVTDGRPVDGLTLDEVFGP
ncbi:hypothetical protein OHV05_37520 (plasmid) [Kitasatospora sp. NBC_00070]|uniref:hypothetical protein n=1 Tax=Kitasatospora sp. NBC_00070 TaxID=2975962 RepID=UPI002F917ED1